MSISVISYNDFSDTTEEGDESRYTIIMLEVGDATDAEIQEYVDDRYPSEHCQHEYDCCGHWYQMFGADIDHSGHFAKVTLVQSQNI